MCKQKNQQKKKQKKKTSMKIQTIKSTGMHMGVKQQ